MSGPQPRPRPIYTSHVRDRCRQKGIDDAEVEFVCSVAPVEDYDPANDSYKLDQWVTGGHLCVPIDAPAHDERGQFVVKTAYWLDRIPEQRREEGP